MSLVSGDVVISRGRNFVQETCASALDFVFSAHLRDPCGIDTWPGDLRRRELELKFHRVILSLRESHIVRRT